MRNFGGQKANLRGMGNGPVFGAGGIDLSAMQNAQERAMQGVNALIMDTGKQIFVGLCAKHVALPLPGQPVNAEMVRLCAATAVACAPYFAEACGLVNIAAPSATASVPGDDYDRPLADMPGDDPIEMKGVASDNSFSGS